MMTKKDTDSIEITIERKKGVALYTQIKEAVIQAVKNTSKGKKIILPAQRDLAKKLGVSRNTVSMAYSELERDGLVASYVGKGTVVLRGPHEAENQKRKSMLLKNIRHSLEEALAMGYSLDDYRDSVLEYLQERHERFGHVKLVFVECNREQLIYFSEHLISDSGVKVIPVLLRDIRGKLPEAVAELKSADCVVTSFFHMEELENLVDDDVQPIVGIHLQPEMQTIVKIARIPSDAIIGLVCSSRQFLEEMKGTLETMHIDQSRLRLYHSKDNEESLLGFLHRVDAVIVSPSRKDHVQSIVRNKAVVEFLFVPDKASINGIHLALLEIKRNVNNEEDVR